MPTATTGLWKTVIFSESKLLGPGSIALILPGDGCSVGNPGGANATYFSVNYKSRKPTDANRGKNAGGSTLVDWDTLTFLPHDKGGIRRYFDRKSAASERLEIHVTTLNPGIKSHEPHSHNPLKLSR